MHESFRAAPRDDSNPVKAFGHKGCHTYSKADQCSEEKTKVRARLMADITKLGADFLLELAHLTLELAHLSFELAHFTLELAHLTFEFAHFTFELAHLAFEVAHLGTQDAEIILNMLGSRFQEGKSMFHDGILRERCEASKLCATR